MRKNPPFPSKTLNDTHDIMTFMTHCTIVYPLIKIAPICLYIDKLVQPQIINCDKVEL